MLVNPTQKPEDAVIHRLLRENAELRDVTACAQTRCTELLDEVRANRRLAESSASQLHVLSHIAFERHRQDARWGDCTAPGRLRMKDGTGGEAMVLKRDLTRLVVDEAMAQGVDTWAMILREEVAEVMAETDPKALRAELVQVAAVAVLWIEMIDRRP